VKEGRFVEAFAALGPERFAEAAARETSVEGLLSLADTARLSGHPGQAVLPLERVLSEFSQSPLAAVSAFTLGRVLLDQLHDPSAAAQAFERAITMHPPHALLADCHARLVEAYSRAGDHASARRAASRYRTLFPTGRHNVDVEAWTKD
jgi:transmembrane sensor